MVRGRSTMVEYLKLVYDSDTVDLSKANCAVRRLINNPVFVYSIPKEQSTTESSPKGSNQIVINLAMFTDRFILTFDLTDGIGAGSSYSKLVRMASNSPLIGGGTAKVTFYYGAATYEVTIEELSMGTQPGKLNLLPGCSATLIWQMTL